MRSAMHRVGDRPTLRLLVKVPAEIERLEVSDDSLTLTDPCRFVQLEVMARHTDGIDRDATHPATGTAYVSGDTQVATVSTYGKVRGQGNGATTIEIRNGKATATVRVTVEATERGPCAPRPPDAPPPRAAP